MSGTQVVVFYHFSETAGRGSCLYARVMCMTCGYCSGWTCAYACVEAVLGKACRSPYNSFFLMFPVPSARCPCFVLCWLAFIRLRLMKSPRRGPADPWRLRELLAVPGLQQMNLALICGFVGFRAKLRFVSILDRTCSSIPSSSPLLFSIPPFGVQFDFHRKTLG